MFRPAFAGLVLVSAACASRETANAPPVNAAPVEPARSIVEPQSAPTASAPANASSLESNAGTYLIRFAPAANALPDNEPFELELWIAERAQPSEPARDVELAVDAAMPEHGHGMVRAPVVERAGDGHFIVRGMLLHMTGRWELYFDITRGAITERAQLGVTLE